MPRTARVKSDFGIYHIIVKSISELLLFKEAQDKIKYLNLIKDAEIQYGFKVYAYCLMSNHGHFIIDTLGSDISTIMQKINLRYAIYFNKKYERNGHVFLDRFKSKIVKNDKYLLNLCLYIHNNPEDISEYKHKLHKYEFSSLGIYLGLRSDTFNILDESFIMQYLNNDVKKARISYSKIMALSSSMNLEDILDTEFKTEKSEYRSERKIIVRNFSAETIIGHVSNLCKNDTYELRTKYDKRTTRFRSLSVFMIHTLCNVNFRKIAEIIGDITLSEVSYLCNKGLDIVKNNSDFKNVINDFIVQYS